MKSYSCKNAPIKVFGIPFFEEKKQFTRLPDEVLAAVPSLEFLGRRTPGGRVCFKTNATQFTVKVSLETLTMDVGMSIYNCQAAFVFIGERTNARFAGIVHPMDYETKVFEATFYKDDTLEDITVYLPRNEIINDIEIIVDDNAVMEEPTPYKYGKPIVFYGSSITEGGCSCNVSNAYNAIVCRHLDSEYYNLGFSGSAKGEPEMADYINTLPMSIFVLDYDHNAPTVEHLLATHEPFFKRIREVHPELPILMMTRPAIRYDDDEKARREVVRRTYENALAAGDKNVYFLDGETFYGECDRDACTVDMIHPNDLGFYRMAMVVEPVLRKILEERYQ